MPSCQRPATNPRRCSLPVVIQLTAVVCMLSSAVASTDPAPAFLTTRWRRSHNSPVVLSRAARSAVFSTNGDDTDQVGGEGTRPMTTAEIVSMQPRTEDSRRITPRAEESLYSTAYATVCASTLIYKYAKLQRKNSDLKALLEPPISLNRAMDVVLDNIEDIFDVCSKEEAKNVLQTLHSLRKGSDEAEATEWIDFEDPPSNKEPAYGILVNHELKRCTVVFRGSDNNSDFAQDGKIPMVKRNNPVKEMRDQTRTILLHQGFEEYLFSRGNKVYQIMYKIKPFVQDGYSLCFTGHSLGGSLATIAGFYIAASSASELRLSSPVQVYTFGSPRVGDKSFYDAFLDLESRNKIRHARFHNRMDLVARLPTRAPPPNRVPYAHVGMDITLQADKPPLLTYAPSITDEDGAMKALLSSKSFQTTELSRFPAGGSVGGVVSKGLYHDVATYLDRIKKAHEQEEDPVTLEEAYQRMRRKKG